MKIKELREEKNLTQEALALAVGTSQRNIGRWENGINEPLYSQLLKLADFFNCSIDYLVGRTDDETFIIKQNDRTVAPMGDALTQDEKDLLKFYRGLNNVQKETVAVLAESLYGKNKAEVGKIS
ncbi:MAG: helix-turn-helix transcriptional regulator [Clostridia bacterium]|nr:helix-turn-helix transcriptional regulator [Clostridia bacterium]